MKNIVKIIIICLGISAIYTSCSKQDSLSAESVAGSGIGGSLARFTIVNEYLYVVDQGKLFAFSLASPTNPVQSSVTEVGFNIETIFPFGDKLFIGSMEAMYIYSLSNPAKPVQMGVASHLRACDPVVANDSTAYVTVRSGSACGGELNALLVYNVQNPMMPELFTTVNMSNPRGLALQKTALYVCDDANGLKVMSLENPYSPQLRQTVTGEVFHDCIALDGTLICMVEGGMAIYDITDPFNLKLLSLIKE